ncbi:MAG: AAA family ATPase [Bacteroidota bacterium]
MKIGITSLKGGVGKSQLSMNLAVFFAHEGYSVAIIDSDTNQTCSQWSGLRAEDLPDVMVAGMTDPKQIRRNIGKLEESFDIVIIDGVPALSQMASTIILLSDLLLIPLIASPADLWATEKFLDRFDEARTLKGEDIPSYFVYNLHNERLNLTKEVAEVINEYDIQALKGSMRNRVAYRECVAVGKGVLEYKDEKAKAELQAIGKEVHKLVKAISRWQN